LKINFLTTESVEGGIHLTWPTSQINGGIILGKQHFGNIKYIRIYRTIQQSTTFCSAYNLLFISFLFLFFAFAI